jgi:hypothetical protein
VSVSTLCTSVAPDGELALEFVTEMPIVAEVVDVGSGHGAVCAYVLFSVPLYAKVSPDPIGCGGFAIGLRDTDAANGD